MTLDPGVAQNHVASHQVKCGNGLGDSETPSTTKMTGGFGIHTSDLFGDRPLKDILVMCDSIDFRNVTR